MGLLKASTKLVTEPGKASNIIVEVTDAAGKLICWGGPYTEREAGEAIALFEEWEL